MKVFVTGGAGYIGSITVEQLIKAGDEVIVFDNLYQGHRDAVHPAAIFIQGDLKDRAAIDAALAAHRPDAIMHFASYTLVGESMERPFLYLGDNVVNGVNLLQSALAHGVKKFILSSTANLFDKPERIPIDEDERIIPGSPYGESKNILERILYWLDRTQGMRYACLRYFNACGASEERGEHHEPETHIIPLVLQVALGQREEFCIFGDDYPTPDGTCIRDYIHVIDLANAHILALRALDGGSRTYNLGNGRGFSVKEVVETARAVTGHPIPTRVVGRRPGDPAVLVASSEKIRRELGWTPQYPDLRTIIETAWRWHRTHPHGYAK
ncbi:UDP-glucose 4-epimerase GalE [Caldilinea sp.]|jgi:UDP-glucose 4-epimerase|uniref:UDP-glucose 4-epimerase GalE n=1 Tax=Caldilinea sp. TaxID=2293560 RepID=UPI0021DD41C5|nr:UDP-glucose 4-epimerase GalE [Caldilinea sp.]GIV67685.1 MAG: UDP-glucose 4-epimerase [Caldilinea sp.]